MSIPKIVHYFRRFWYLSLLSIPVALFAWHLVNQAPAGEGKKVYGLTVPKGAGFAHVAKELERKGIVKSSLYLMVSGRLGGLDRKMQAGDYRLTDAMTPLAIMEKMASGVTDACRFTLPEGYSMFQAAELLEKQGIFGREEFLEACRDKALLADARIESATAEGYLYPGTYLIGFQMDERGLVTEMFREFRKRTAGLDSEISASGLTIHQAVTLASIIEKEALSAEEKPLIASVFRNRLRIGMPLQSDPTAIYGVKVFGGTVTKGDLQRSSPYNTYRIKGLPPGAIGNPGIDSIKAVLKPAATDYLYFVSRKDGTHQFSRSLSEHNRGVSVFLKNRKKKKQVGQSVAPAPSRQRRN